MFFFCVSLILSGTLQRGSGDVEVITWTRKTGTLERAGHNFIPVTFLIIFYSDIIRLQLWNVKKKERKKYPGVMRFVAPLCVRQRLNHVE